MNARTDPADFRDRDLHELHAHERKIAMSDPFQNIPNADDSLNGEFSPAKVTRPVRVYGITDRTIRASAFLAEANDAGLPMPGYVSISSHDHGEFRSSGIRFQLASNTEVDAWAEYFGQAVTIEQHGSSVTLEKSGQHDVQAYLYEETAETPAPPPVAAAVPEATAPAGIPGLAEHTQAAQADYQPKCGDRVTGPRGDGTVVDTAAFSNASKVEYDEHRLHRGRFVIEPNTSLKLAEATQAACDTITRASQ